MNLEGVIPILIYAHAALGVVALLTGLVALIVVKGNRIHKKSGKIFYYTMLASAIIAISISVMPNHESDLLFGLGIFTVYLLIAGYRSLRFKRKKVSLNTDRHISIFMIIAAVFMIGYPLIFKGQLNIVLTVFGTLGLVIATRDLYSYKSKETLTQKWLKLHLSKMIGGYISAVTAFIIVNNFFSGLYGWFIPGIIGGFYIAFWLRKLNVNNNPKAAI